MKPFVFDVSHWQTITDYADFDKAGVIGLIHKASQGHGSIDPKYQARKKYWKVDNSRLFASYHLCGSAGNDEAVKTQADFFLKIVGDYSNEILFLDYEDGGSGLLTPTQAALFLQYVKDTTGRPVGIYASDFILQGLLPHMPEGTIIWVAEYGVRAPKKTAKWDFWQFTEAGKLPGEVGTWDIDYFNSDNIEDLYTIWDVPYKADAVNPLEGDTQEDGKSADHIGTTNPIPGESNT